MEAHENDVAAISGIELVERYFGVTKEGKPGPIIKFLIIPLSIRRYEALPDEGLFARCFDENDYRVLGGLWKLYGEPRGRALGWVNTPKPPDDGSCGDLHRHVLWTPDEKHIYHDRFSRIQFGDHPLLRALPQLCVGTEEDE